jgi:hypothetical protein
MFPMMEGGRPLKGKIYKTSFDFMAARFNLRIKSVQNMFVLTNPLGWQYFPYIDA